MSDSMKELKEELFGIEEVTEEMRQYHFDITGQYASDSIILEWFNATPSFKPSGVEFNQAYDECIKIAESCKYDMVKQPKHYMFFDMEVIDIIKASMTKEQFIGYCKGNCIKYRLRAGKKDNTIQDIAKAEEYEKFYEQINND